MNDQAQNILIIGAGAIGCTLAWHLSGKKANVTLLARGRALEAIRQQGITLHKGAQNRGTRLIQTIDHLHAALHWDAIFVCVKQYDLAGVIASLQHADCRNAVIIPLVNGIPWWLLQTHERLRHEAREAWGPAYAGFPDVDATRLIGGVIHIPAQMRDACTVEQGGRDTLALGEIDGSMSERLAALVATIDQSDLQCKASHHIQHELWNKLLGNAVFNPVSALTNATMHQMLNDPGLRTLCAQLMGEVMQVGSALGLPQDISVEARLAQSESAGHARTSMLQDAWAGRRIEGDTLVGSVSRIARCLGVATPMLDGIWALLHQRFMRAS
ncbi:2-dehydropantoate 2-reductase [Diaphorobacter sp. HDW4A]|uniref:ketopantoate reductase family protein n=1 Tax=Diaphorobacter sp. HDW4A TaxID=2714924 RepID=UPI00140DA096|nr:2-dehydropantoate 2-reductase [Diaphorobacter sp. HDW4A]QIL82724.1 2-dehydropantoate 2-reductase [Diaphorobacter sp. HDW4A]